MEFNTLVERYLLPVFQKYGFEKTEEFENIVRFQSSEMRINLAFNDYDNSHLVELGRRGEMLFPLNDNTVRRVWGSSAFPVEQVTSKVFVQNLSLLFEKKEGIELLEGNIDLLKSILIGESEYYTTQLMRTQELEAASKAWENGDYLSFVDSIDKIGVSKLPKSYQLKYKIAKQKLK